MAEVSQEVFSIKTKKPIRVDDAVDEDALLTDADKQAKVARKEEGDCTTRRRACKNCVCGRAEQEAQMAKEGKITLDADDDDGAAFQPPPGGCGSCAKGDAFRCASCPYLGKPAWNSGEGGKVTVNLTDDS